MAAMGLHGHSWPPCSIKRHQRYKAYGSHLRRLRTPRTLIESRNSWFPGRIARQRQSASGTLTSGKYCAKHQHVKVPDASRGWCRDPSGKPEGAVIVRGVLTAKQMSGQGWRIDGFGSQWFDSCRSRARLTAISTAPPSVAATRGGIRSAWCRSATICRPR